MANINITSDAWTEISITSGTVQNISATADIELSAEQTDNSGVVLKPSEIYQWDNETIYARAVTEKTGALRVVNFKKATGGGGGYVLPVASSSTLGGVKVGTNLSIDSDGVLSSVGTVSYSTTEQEIGTWIDGKPLYQITYSVTSPTDATPLEVASLPASVTPANVFYLDAILLSNDGACFSVNYAQPVNDDVRFVTMWIRSNNNIVVNTLFSMFFSCPMFITIRYTKTTD